MWKDSPSPQYYLKWNECFKTTFIHRGMLWQKDIPGSFNNVDQIPSLTKRTFNSDQWERMQVRLLVKSSLPFQFLAHQDFEDLITEAQLSTSKPKLLHPRTAPLPSGAKLSIALNYWTSPFTQAFMAITGYFVDADWNFREILLAFKPLSGTHSGENLGTVVFKVLQDHDIMDRVLAVTTNNASNNSTLVENLQQAIDSLELPVGSTTPIIQIPCLAYMIQLSLRDLLGAMKRALNVHDRSQGIRYTLLKIRKFAVYINASPQRREAFTNLQQAHLKLVPIQDTKGLSKSKEVTIYNVFKIYNLLFGHFEKSIHQLIKKKVVWKQEMLSSLQAGKKKLSIYYNKTEEQLASPPLPVTAISQTTSQFRGLFSDSQPQQAKKLSSNNELTTYLNLGQQTEQDPCTYWRDQQRQFPTLARLARDVFSIPATGAGVERLFNSARDICHYRRGSLSPSTIQALMLFRCTSNFEVEQDELNLYKQVYTREELDEIEERREASFLKVDGINPISDDEEEDLPSHSQRPIQRSKQRPSQRSKQRSSQQPLRKRRRRSRSLYSIPDDEDDEENPTISLPGPPDPDPDPDLDPYLHQPPASSSSPSLEPLEPSKGSELDLPPQKGEATQSRMSTRFQGEKRPRREDSMFVSNY
ncbi:uncharacterized protein N7484_001717 [Penicillium longicatenatum]|uniref:uncharacterized protein n=1 Tax=Penicillium longicatenatum TaxID=1561947 RepID=UPI00254796EA|nr:uncharacterized protein N7484_001717 [Penicillium longicatenatum]KAJ5658068.1 hypothetical protein N7484_001717 [Penicillium longicatenatum]